MDFRNFCSKFDMDAIKAKFPHLPDVMTQFKLPKSIGKLKARSKIFRSSREDVHSSTASIKKRSSKDDINSSPFAARGGAGGGGGGGLGVASLPLGSSQEFVNHTPQRISTISSLVDQRGNRSRQPPPGASIKRKHPGAVQSDDTFYRSAGGIEEYCPSPPAHTFNNSIYDISMSPKAGRGSSAAGASNEDVKLSFADRMQKGYKDVSDFRLKHIFVKKTVVRQDNIALHQYIDQYSEDRRCQEVYDDKLDRVIADNYDFEFKTSRRKSEESFGISSPSDSDTNAAARQNAAKKLSSEHSGDESGMELSPPNRKPGIAATRFARVRKVPLRMSIDEDEDMNHQQIQRDNSEENQDQDEDVDADEDEDVDEEIEIEEEEVRSKSGRDVLPTTVRRQKSKEQQLELSNASSPPAPPPPAPRPKSIKQRLSQLTWQTKTPSPAEHKETSPKKRRAPLSPQESKDLPSDPSDSRPSSPPDGKQTGGGSAGKLGTIKENIRRFQKSFKLSNTSLAQSQSQSQSQSAGMDSEADDANAPSKLSKTQQFAERLKRFRSVDNVNRQTDEEQERPEEKSSESPMHKLTSKLQEWKKSIKRKPPATAAAGTSHNSDDEDGENSSPQKRQEKPVAGSLMKKLRHIRSRKTASTDDPDDDEEGGASYREGFRSRAKLQLEKGVAAASQMPSMTMEKLRETKKFFRKTQKEKSEDKDREREKQQKKMAKNNSDESDLEEDSVASDSKAKQRLHGRQPRKLSKDSSGKGATARHYYSSDDEEEDDDDDDEEEKENAYERGMCKVTSMDPHQPKVLVPLARAAWTNKSIHSDSLDTADDDDDMLPRVLLHQNNSDMFESTIIIAVTRPMSRTHSPSPFITELPPDSSPETKADNWKPNRAMATFHSDSESMPGMRRELFKDAITSASSSRGHSRKHSMDSSSEDSWIKDVPRGISTALGLNSVCEMDEPWRVHGAVGGKKYDDGLLYKSKSIDIFEKSMKGLKIFEDFDDELKNTPVVKIKENAEIHVRPDVDSFEQDSGEDFEEDNADDDNSSRVTRILKQTKEKEEQKQEEVLEKKRETPPRPPPPTIIKNKDINLKAQLYGNSTESLMGHLDSKDKNSDDDSEPESDDEQEDEDEDDDEEEMAAAEDKVDEVGGNRPPSAAPSPPPSMSPPPPPLPQRQPSIRLSKLSQLPEIPQPITASSSSAPPLTALPEKVEPPKSLPPPLPQTKPPELPIRPTVLPNPPPKIPERTPSMTRIAKPLVKTSSLRLAYDEQVNPQDVGKVNKLISQFEPNGGGGVGVGRSINKDQRRPRIIPRIPFISQSSEDYSEDEEEREDDTATDESDRQQNSNNNNNYRRESSRELSLEKTPTNKPRKPIMQKSFSIDTDELPKLAAIKNNNPVIQEEKLSLIRTREILSATSMTMTPPPPLQAREMGGALPPIPPYIPSISISSLSLQSDQNSNFSQASSEYGSPMTYPSSRSESNEVTPRGSPKEITLLLSSSSSRRSRRSMTRDDEKYFSFDSDEETSYYSIGSNRSNRYVVDL